MNRIYAAALGFNLCFAACASTTPADQDGATDGYDWDMGDAGEFSWPDGYDVMEFDIVEVAEPICIPGVGTCIDSDTINICNEDGSAYVIEDCPAGHFCVDDQCTLQICEPGSWRCVDPVTYEVCDETGTGYIPGGTCDEVAGERCFEGVCLTACEEAVLRPSSVGCVFYAVDLDQDDSLVSDLSPYAIVVSNTNDTGLAAVVVEDRQGGGDTWRTRASQVIGPNSLYTFRLSPDQHVEDTNIQSGIAYRITSDRPVIAYQFNPIDSASQYTNDAALLLPKSTLDRYYWTAAWPGYPGLTMNSNITVAGTQDGTSVTITVPAATQAGGGIPALAAGGSTTQTIDEGTVLQIAGSGEADMTGTYIESSAPVAVFSGCECADVPMNCSWCVNWAGSPAPTCHWCDHLEEQMFPLTAWGKRYIAARVPVRSSGGVEASYWKIIASEDDTTVTISYEAGTAFRSSGGMPPFTMSRGQVIPFEMAGNHMVPGDALIEADKPILVVQYIEGQECTDRGAGDGGDPAMILMVPMEQYLAEYIFLTPDTYANDYVVVIKKAAATVLLDAAPVTGTSFPVALGWEIYRPEISDGVHHIEGTEPFGIIGVGYSPYVSYGYMGGLALESINPQD